MTDKQIIIDVYECPYYRRNILSWCKYYPKGCNECGDLTKVGEEIINDR